MKELYWNIDGNIVKESDMTFDTLIPEYATSCWASCYEEAYWILNPDIS